MNSIKIFAISMVCSAPINPEAEEDAQVSKTSQWVNRLPWEDILRESVFRTISPPSLANNILYKRILTALFYHGPLPAEIDTDADSVALSRGNIYQLANGRWIMCQDGCHDCEPCLRATNPIIKWIIKRIKRVPTHDVPRHDLQLTIIPQVSGNHQTVNDSPTSYVYVATPGEMLAYSSDAYVNTDDASAPTGTENNSSAGMIDRFPSQPIEQGVTPVSIQKCYSSTIVENTTASTEPTFPKKERSRQLGKQRPPLRINEKAGFSNCSRNRSKETTDLPAQLILGTDQLGQKQLVHVVVAGGGADYARQDSLNTWPGNEEARLVNDSGKPDYQELLRRIFHSLVTHRRSIERFLQSGIKGDVHSTSFAADGAKDELELGHRMKRMNPAIGFYPSYNQVNNNQPAMATQRSFTSRQSQERKESVAPISTIGMLNSLRNESQVIGT